ncbi:hypothetical protein EJ06DRAFT_536366 [Trichodelitschia bisporula]|uniref:Heterokaryon incompatibility domain-containing protein n=1 Tax=Trichodelitschia bisporula TaxID=703511 RepID=A0A6G1I3C9_9PEZI|nr:hypothetical protein EJ06DRAFT_536366 [Trichodelitschia bisporula]
MRVINVHTRELEQLDPRYEQFPIVSHKWGKTEDKVTFQDYSTPEAKDKKDSDNIYFVWIDTVCIDKSSSTELSEAINSMFQWYSDAQVCYAYLDNVHDRDLQEFAESKWFTRGWTLQELIAPWEVCFYDSSWNEFGSRLSLLEEIMEITRISRDTLVPQDSYHRYIPIADRLRRKSVAHRMSCAAGCFTTRVEDEAYCLLVIFQINMPLLYGEGRKAFIRLQEEIVKTTADHSILALGLRLKLNI